MPVSRALTRKDERLHKQLPNWHDVVSRWAPLADVDCWAIYSGRDSESVEGVGTSGVTSGEDATTLNSVSTPG
jgi:hypothetical protein